MTGCNPFRSGLWLALTATVLLAAGQTASAQANRIAAPQSAPHSGYWASFEPYYEGDFREAGSGFRDAASGGIITTSGRWIDSICYHAMMGECFYQMGNLTDALDQYSAALKLFLVQRNWMLRIDFDSQPIGPAENIKTTVTWGPSSRKTILGHFPDRWSSFQGRLDNQNVLRTGGVIEPPQLHPVFVAEIVRCTALALSRRREIMGPVCEHDPLTEQLVTALAARPGPPNHWSQSWVELELGLAYASANRIPQAVSELQKSLLAAGQYDHPLTCLGLLELGRLAFEMGKYDAAITYCHEATISAAFFDRFDVMEEAFRLGAEAHLVAGQKGVYPPLAPAAAWATKESRLLHVSLLTSLAEQLCSTENISGAATAIAQARTAMGRHGMSQGAIGSRVNYQAARISLHAGDLKSGSAALTAAVTYEKSGSKRLFQVGLADGLYRSGGVTERIADSIYSDVLREPTRTDWIVEPLATLAILATPHPLPYEHWFELALGRKDQEKALNIAERIRRHRFHVTQPLGGRLVALRWVLAAPEQALSQEAALQRQELLVKFPKFSELSRRAAEIRSQLQALPIVPTEEAQSKQQGELLAELAKVSTAQEALLQMIALERVPSEFVFPPLRETQDLQKELPDGTLVLYYLATSRNVHAFALSKDRYSSFTVSQPAKIKTDIADMLRHLGQYDRTQPVSADDLKTNGWKTAAERLVGPLTGSSQKEDWAKYRELVIVPDSALWYLPFEALPVPAEGGARPLLMQFPIRYTPTLALATGDRRGSRPLARTAVVSGKLLPRDEDASVRGALSALTSAVPGSVALRSEPHAASSIFSATIDRLVVLKDLEDFEKLPFGWSPLALDAGKPGSTLADWSQLPFGGVDQIVLPGFHTPAEYALKRGGTGDDLFLTTCGLMASGCRTILLSRWRVGGQSTVDLMREFVQELPHEPADVAWRRSVQLAADRPLDTSQEGRLKASAAASAGVRANHPFFWAGYLLVDTGVTPAKELANKPLAEAAAP